MDREHGKPTNPIYEPTFKPNPGVARFGARAAQQYISNSPETLDALRDEYMAQDPNMLPEEATALAKQNMAATHSLSSFTSGEIPTDPPWDEALAAIGLGPDTDELVFNEENTRVTMSQAVAASQAEGATASTSKDLLVDAPVLLPHQVKGKNQPSPPYPTWDNEPCPIWDKHPPTPSPLTYQTCQPPSPPPNPC